MKIITAIAILAAVFGLSSCGSTNAAIGANGRPTVLRYAVVKTSLEAEDVSNRRQQLTRAYLERELHMKVEMIEASQYSGVIEAFRAKKIDLGSIQAFSYVLATQSIPIEAIAMRGKDGDAGSYKGVLAVRGDSPLKTIDDVIKHSKDLTISFVDPASASGFLVQSAFLSSKGLDPQHDFKKVVFSLTHPASLLSLAAGKVEVAASMVRLVDTYERIGKVAKGGVRILWTSPDIPNGPIAVRKELPQAFKEELRRVLIEMPQKDPETWKSQQVRLMPRPEGEVYVPATDANFDELRAMARGVKNLSLLER